MYKHAFASVLITTNVSIAQKANKLPNPNPDNVKVVINGELKKWHKITLTFDGPETSEMENLNPFMNYRFDVYFTHKESGKTLKVPGYFAADGNAGETSATLGKKWRVHYAPLHFLPLLQN